MGDALKKVQPGQRLEIPAAAYNTFIDMARDWLKSQLDDGGFVPGSRFTGTALVKNVSGEDRIRFEILGIGGILFGPSDNADEFKNGPVLQGTTPTFAAYRGRFAVLAEPIANDKIGRAVLLGVTPVQLDVVNAFHAFADVKDGDATVLQTGVGGAARVLYKEDGTGTKWGIVALGLPAEPLGGVFAVTVDRDGGQAGDQDNSCTFTYTVKDLAGATLATGVTPKRPRLPNVTYNDPGTCSHGTAYREADGNLVLIEVLEEVFQTDTCP